MFSPLILTLKESGARIIIDADSLIRVEEYMDGIGCMVYLDIDSDRVANYAEVREPLDDIMERIQESNNDSDVPW